jgi:predicted house-cleaning noncanonical NTP pyrophosphatase (MazG superfamily)
VKIALLVEGPSDEQTLKILIHKILGKQVSIESRVLKGRGNILNEKKVRAIINNVISNHPKVSKTIVCVDSECTPEEEARKEAEEIEKIVNSGMQHPIYYVCVIHALEGWLLADAEAIQECLGQRVDVKIAPSATYDCKPKETMKAIFKRNGKEYIHTRNNPQIAEKINIDKIIANNKSFLRFRDKVKDP